MPDNRQKILEMLDAKKISVEEAMKLLDAVERPAGGTGAAKPDGRSIKYLRVLVDSPHGFKDEHGYRGEGPAKVNIRVPVGLIRAGMKFTALLPKEASDQIDARLKEKGVSFNLRNIKDEDIEELIQALAELEVDVDGGDKVRVFAE
jgi:hypothetical protein